MKEADKINCFFYFEDGTGNNKTALLFSGTEKGIYISSDMGNSWIESIIKNPEMNNNILIYGFYSNYDYVNSKNVIYGYGWDGVNNLYYTTDKGISWKNSNLNKKGKVNIILTFYYIAHWGTVSFTGWITIMSLFESYNSYIYSNLKIIFDLGKNNQINTIIHGTNDLLCLGAEKGFYICTDILTNKWEKRESDLTNITTLLSTNNKIFAGTPEGAFLSNDFGKNWRKLSLGANEISVTKIYELNNVIYFVSDSMIYKSKLPEDIVSPVYNPIKLFPQNDSKDMPTEITFKWESLNKTEKDNYILQLSPSASFDTSDTESIEISLQNSYKVSGLKSNTKYFWRMKVFNLYGSTDYTGAFTFTTK
jgi:hypothetical protein